MSVASSNFVELFKFLNDHGFANRRGTTIYNYIMEFINTNCFEYNKNGRYSFIFTGSTIDLSLRRHIPFLSMQEKLCIALQYRQREGWGLASTDCSKKYPALCQPGSVLFHSQNAIWYQLPSINTYSL